MFLKKTVFTLTPILKFLVSLYIFFQIGYSLCEFQMMQDFSWGVMFSHKSIIKFPIPREYFGTHCICLCVRMCVYIKDSPGIYFNIFTKHVLNRLKSVTSWIIILYLSFLINFKSFINHGKTAIFTTTRSWKLSEW